MATTTPTLKPRMRNVAMIIPEAREHIQALAAIARNDGPSRSVLDLVHLRVSQINGCSSCVAGGSGTARQAGETEERLSAVAAWRDSPRFTDQERAVLALAEAVTRLSDRPNARIVSNLLNQAGAVAPPWVICTPR